MIYQLPRVWTGIVTETTKSRTCQKNRELHIKYAMERATVRATVRTTVRTILATEGADDPDLKSYKVLNDSVEFNGPADNVAPRSLDKMAFNERKRIRDIYYTRLDINTVILPQPTEISKPSTPASPSL